MQEPQNKQRGVCRFAINIHAEKANHLIDVKSTRAATLSLDSLIFHRTLCVYIPPILQTARENEQ